MILTEETYQKYLGKITMDGGEEHHSYLIVQSLIEN